MDETRNQPPGTPDDQAETAPFVQGEANTPGSPETNDPPTIGRYRVVRRLGKGGFGTVYLAQDEDLKRPVAIKVPNPERISRPEAVEAYLNEARILASLDHPHIVPVYDLGRTDDGLCFVVSKFVEGSDLAARIKESRPAHHDSAALVATVAEALHYAHTRGLVHRDIKPANILIDTAGRPCVADFGLALRDEDFGQGARRAGTPDYMSPEQARGEGHRVDGRSDIFSLGVVFYLLLTGRKPFSAPSRRELLDLIATTEARPPRQIDDTIPKELERICQKALSKRASERYSTGKDMAEDLRLWLQGVAGTGSPVAAQGIVGPPPGSTQEATPLRTTPKPSDSELPLLKIIPKGLRAFDEHDADFFLELLPGPRDREGLPDSLRFWKTRIETIDADRTFKVGLIYGPSGCGKSSLVKAGLLPRLAKHVLPVYIEATPEETESRLLRALRKACPDLPPGLGLVDALMTIRQGRVLRSGQKVLLVLDQFEQWLHARRGEENSELVNALRQCDGEHLQAVVMVRDDFWMAATRFLDALEVELLKGQNAAAVDLFDPRHARKVLAAFGTAYGNLPARTGDISRDQHAFLDQAVGELAQDGKVISVRLALFAEMVKGKPWTPATLREVGGTEGVGVTFLEETFASPQANPKHRLHEKAAQAVLKALLPGTGSDIKGQMCPEGQLQAAAAYADRPREFADLLHILDNELRLITPTDPAGSGDERPPASPGGRYYQLTHDYLVHSLRDWLTRKQRETRRGRAALRLAERSSLWNDKPESRHLPSVLEWANIRLLTRRRDWTDPQRKMMTRAGRLHGLRALGVAALIGLLAWGGIEGYGALRGSSLVESLKTASTADVPSLVRQLGGVRRWANPRLVRLAQSSDDDSREKLHASLALLPVDDSQVPFLEKRLLMASPIDLPVIRDALKPHRAALVAKLWSVVDSAKPGDELLLTAASALADYDATSPQWEAASGKVAQALVTVNPVFLGPWLEALRPVRGRLNPSLDEIFQDRTRPESEQALAASILADFAADEPDRLARLLEVATTQQYPVLYPIVASQSAPAIVDDLYQVAATPPPPQLGSVERVPFGQRRANAAVTLLRLGERDKVLPVFEWTDDPEALTQFVFRCRERGVGVEALLDCLERVGNAPPERYPRHARYALLLALGEFPLADIPESRRAALLEQLAAWYGQDPASGVHGATGWLLRHWGQAEVARQVDQTAVPYSPDREWFTLAITVTPAHSTNAEAVFQPARQPTSPVPPPSRKFHYTFVVFPAGEYTVGSVSDEPGRVKNEDRHSVTLTRPFALLDREITFEELIAFKPLYAGLMRQYEASPPDAGFGVAWYDAVVFCRWLGQQSGLPETDQAYADPATLDREQYPREPDPGANWAPRNWPLELGRRGFRLPTEAEWELASRAGARTSYGFGSDESLLGRFGWYIENTCKHVHPPRELRPSLRGVYDLQGNLWEWTHDWFADYDTVASTDPLGPKGGSLRVIRGGGWVGDAAICRSAYRRTDAPTYRSGNLGLRLVLSPSGALPEAGKDR